MITPGTKVTWTSQANASAKTKAGRVVAYLPARQSLHAACPELKNVLRSHIKTDMDISQLDRYVVAVTRPSGTLDYYTPNARVVERSQP